MPYSSTFGLHILPVPHSAPHSAPHSVPHSVFHFVTGLLITSEKFQFYSTNLHTRDYHSGQKQFLSILPDFQENLHCVYPGSEVPKSVQAKTAVRRTSERRGRNLWSPWTITSFWSLSDCMSNCFVKTSVAPPI